MAAVVGPGHVAASASSSSSESSDMDSLDTPTPDSTNDAGGPPRNNQMVGS